MVSAIKRTVIEAEDWLQYSPVFRGMVSRYKCWRESDSAPSDHQATAHSIRNLCSAARLTNNLSALAGIEKKIRHRLHGWDPLQVDWTEFVANVDDPALYRGVILKPWVSDREPGVFFVGFEVEWIKLLRHCDLKKFSRRYMLIVGPSSNPYNLINYAVPAAYPGTLFSLINHDDDLEIVPRIGPNYRMIPLYTSHWVNPALFHPRPRAGRDIDLIMVASFGKVKRHHLLFRALRHMPRELRILLIGQDQDGRTAQTINDEARFYGVANRFEIVANAKHPEVLDALGRSRASVLLSLREGSAVVVSESLFADTPTALLHDAYNGSRAFINEQTGVFLHEENLAEQLMSFLQRAEEFAPRQWADDNISCYRSTVQLNRILRDYAVESGLDWTQDIAPWCWSPDPRLVSPEDRRRFEPEYRYVREHLGLDLGARELDS